MTDYDFGEKITEYSSKQKKEIPVWVSPKYTQSREKAIEIIEKYKDITPGDFWILMNETKTGKMAYAGLIISHNACLKINDAMEDKMKFKPSCVTVEENAYKNSLVFTYINDEQGIYEVGEVSDKNCSNSYPYAMALKRCIDRVVLKNCKLAYNGVYSDSEADEFKEPIGDNENEPAEEKKINKNKQNPPVLTREELEDKVVALCDVKRKRVSEICKMAKVTELGELNEERLQGCIDFLNKL